MNLIHDYVAPTPAGGRCRIRLYLPEEPDYSPVVICTELTDNPGMSVTNCAEVIAASVLESNPDLAKKAVHIPVPSMMEIALLRFNVASCPFHNGIAVNATRVHSDVC